MMNDEFAAIDAEIDAALNSYPLAQLPPNFTGRVMSQVETTPQIDPHFRLQFIDFALPGFILVFVTAVFIFSLWLTGIGTMPGIPLTSASALFTYLKTTLPLWALLSGGILLLELIVSLVIAAQIISDPPQVTQAAR